MHLQMVRVYGGSSYWYCVCEVPVISLMRMFLAFLALVTGAELQLLAAARASMEERVACQVEGETAARLAAARRRMAADVDAQVAREQATLLSERQVRWESCKVCS